MYNIAIVGNPNSGKTTLFNKLTGANQHIGNWPGVTVEKKEGHFKIGAVKVKVTDLPGIYSLSPYSSEEKITREYILEERPDLILNIIDASNLERNLYLSTQLSELCVPVIYILNMIDIVYKDGTRIDLEILANRFGHRFLAMSASRGTGIDELIEQINKSMSVSDKPKTSINYFRSEIRDGVEKIMQLMEEDQQKEFLAVKLLENDPEIVKGYSNRPDVVNRAEELRKEIEQKYDDDIESMIIVDRYNYVAGIIKESLERSRSKKRTISDKLDDILLNRLLAIPIFLLTMYFVFSITFGKTTSLVVGAFERLIEEIIKPGVSNLLQMVKASDFTQDLILDGVIDGVGAVIVFTPQLVVLFLFISFLEDCGYMARAALLTDKVLRKMGLTGKSFIPFVVGFGCSVPAIMAARTLDSEKDRKLTIFLAPFMSCGARAPVYAMLASAYFVRSRSLVIFSIYLAGILVAFLAGLVLSRTIFKGEDSPFVLELPKYQLPRLKDLLKHTYNRSKEFVKKAGTIILAASVLVWLLTNLDSSLRITSDYSNSLISIVGRNLAVIFKPLGFGEWIPAVAIITGVFAKESVVSTISILSGAKGVGSLFTPLSAYAFLIFILFYVPCIASIAAMKRELNSIRWTAGAVLFQTATAWIMAFIVYNGGRLVGLV